jgi:hypothetical protein
MGGLRVRGARVSETGRALDARHRVCPADDSPAIAAHITERDDGLNGRALRRSMPWRFIHRYTVAR